MFQVGDKVRVELVGEVVGITKETFRGQSFYKVTVLKNNGELYDDQCFINDLSAVTLLQEAQHG